VLWAREGVGYEGECQQGEKREGNPHALAFRARVEVGDHVGGEERDRPTIPVNPA
jgi:hypothetical protein